MTARIQHFAVYRTFTGRILYTGRATKSRRVVPRRGESVAYSRRRITINRHRIVEGRILEKRAQPALLQLVNGVAYIDPPPGAACLEPGLPRSGGMTVAQTRSPRVIRFQHPDYFVPAVRIPPLSTPVKVAP